LGRAPRPDFLALKSGPGAVAEKANHLERYNCPVSDNVLALFPDSDEIFNFITPEWAETHASRMIAVPKTALKPRLIAAEPSWNSFMQQAISAEISKRICRYPFLDIRNQDRNGNLCKDCSLATIDQSRASDRVSLTLVKRLFPVDWLELLLGCRTTDVQCLCGETHHIRKFAGMGAATTFPVETVVFASLAIASILLERQGPDYSTLQGRVGFYGDDAVVPIEYANTVMEAYEASGFIVNHEKTFFSGEFRESCGVYSFQGVNVAPVRLSHWLPKRRSDVDSIESRVSAINALGFWWGDVSVLQTLSGILNVPRVTYSVDRTHSKPSLYRESAGFGWVSEYGDSSKREIAVIRREHYRRSRITGPCERVRLYLSLRDLETSTEDEVLFPRPRLSIAQQYDRRPLFSHLEVR